MDRRSAAVAIFIALAASPAIPTAGAAPATASHPAIRDVSFTPEAVCDLATAQLLSSRHPSTRQFVIVAADRWDSTTATLQIVARSRGGQWRCQLAPVIARLGKSGSRPLVERRSGDGTTPAGVFPLGNVARVGRTTIPVLRESPRHRCAWVVPTRSHPRLLGRHSTHRFVPAVGERPGLFVTRRVVAKHWRCLWACGRHRRKP